MDRIEINVKTGEQVVVPLTPEEAAAALARTAAEATNPVRLQQQADAIAHAEAKADTVVQYLRDHTPAECESYVQINVTDLASARQMLKKFAVALCVLAKQNLR